ncbi:Oxidoreductase NAD-binding domain-containing 1 [Fusarium albosuccineum]|uniref:Oxidoreductase NAD-binding domain-containing protein 1 n=1 Tax=Fusarium albosuccineum TaxID=1237068 RepID=A0A8H4L4Q4_9HYPO|nr:Oxidoreductase NAD-binding domain-containing 1 [Fusarium albosuccineum]
MSTERSGHLERTAQEPRDEGLPTVKLGRIDQVNERIRLFRLMLESGPVKFSAGQWLDTYVPDMAKPGGFTITSPPSTASNPSSPYFELAVQESPENPPAAWLWQSPSEILGSKLRVRVGGSFVFPPRDVSLSEIRRVVFVAGGVGINPLASMMGRIAEEGHDVDVRVLYASKLPKRGLKDILFLERIAGWFAEGKLRGELKVFVTGQASKEIKGTGFEVLKRRFGVEDVREAVGEQVNEEVVYVCGPPDMADEIVEELTGEGGLERRRVMLEKWW